MSTQPPLTEAERLAYAEIYAGAHNIHHSMLKLKPGATCGQCESTARAVVATAEAPIAIAALARTADVLDELAADNARVGRGTAEGPWIAAGVQGAALAVRRQIQSLSRPTPKEQQ